MDLVLPGQFCKPTPKDFQNGKHVLTHTAHKGYIQEPKYQISNCMACFDKLLETYNKEYLGLLLPLRTCSQGL
jgi:hypothetical protein